MTSFDAELADARRRLLEGASNVLIRPAPAGRATALVDANIGHTTVFWEQDAAGGSEASTIVGLDTAALLRASGPGRLADMVARQSTIFSSLRMDASAGSAAARLVRFFGGSAFSTGRDGSGCWEDFGDSTFVLPRVLYVERGGAAEFVIVDLPGAPGGTPRTLEVLESALAVASQASVSSADRDGVDVGSVVSSRDSAGPLEFERLVESAQAEIAAGVVQKVALARRVTLTLERAPRIGALLERLRLTAPGATRFAFRIGERTFVGGTPECLVKRSGSLVETEALAGTAAKSSEAARELFASGKDQEEHRYVVDAIRQALAPVCSRLDVASAPHIKELPRLLHLCTPISGELDAPLNVLELVARLHPTPAVCGAPTEEAFRFIVRHEAAPRGWYAAPFGWVDQTGDGHFVVGLRSALLHGKNVHLYAGAGIVRASEPRLEYEETELKLESIRSALGLQNWAQRSTLPA